jgi:hypothetical protein
LFGLKLENYTQWNRDLLRAELIGFFPALEVDCEFDASRPSAGG